MVIKQVILCIIVQFIAFMCSRMVHYWHAYHVTDESVIFMNDSRRYANASQESTYI